MKKVFLIINSILLSAFMILCIPNVCHGDMIAFIEPSRPVFESGLIFVGILIAVTLVAGISLLLIQDDHKKIINVIKNVIVIAIYFIFIWIIYSFGEKLIVYAKDRGIYDFSALETVFVQIMIATLIISVIFRFKKKYKHSNLFIKIGLITIALYLIITFIIQLVEEGGNLGYAINWWLDSF